MSADKPAAKARPKQTAPLSSSFSPTGIPLSFKKVDWCWTRRTTQPELSCCKDDEYIASTQTSASRKRWSKWILEVEEGVRVSIHQIYVHWSIRSWIDHLRRGGGHKKSFQYCTDSIEQEILLLRAIQGHSRENLVDPSLQDNVLIRDNFFGYIYHVGCYFNTHSIIESGLIAGGKKRQPGSTSGILYSRASFGHASQEERILCDRAPSTPRCSVLDRY